MAKPKAATVPTRGTRLIEVETPSEEMLEVAPDDIELQIAKGEFAGVEGASVTIYRQGIHGRDLTFIDTMPPANFGMTLLKHPPYDGGKFRIIMRDSHGAIQLNRVEQVQPAPPKPPEAATMLSPLAGDAGFAILGKAMVEGFGRIGDAMAKLGELIVTQRPVAPEQKSLMDLLGDVKVLRELVAPVLPSSDPLDMLAKLVSVAKDLPGRGGDDDAPSRGRATEMDVLLETARAILPQLANAAQAQPPVPAIQHRQLPINGQARAPVPGAARPAGAPPVQMNPTALFLNFLVDQAKRGNDPTLYAAVVLDNAPQEIVDEYIHRDDWFAELTKLAPHAAPFRSWFERLRASAIEYLTNDGQQGQTPGESVQGTPPNEVAPGS